MAQCPDCGVRYVVPSLVTDCLDRKCLPIWWVKLDEETTPREGEEDGGDT
jgi:hypothetical protein